MEGKDSIAKLEVGSGAMNFSMRRESESIEDSVEAITPDLPAEFGVNIAYLRDAISCISSDVVCIEYTDHATGLQIYPVDIDDHFSVVMPARL